MAARGERVKFALNPHAAKLLPRLDGVHRGPTVCIAMNEQDRASIQIKGKLRNKTRGIVVAAGGVAAFRAIGQRIGRIDQPKIP